MPPTATTVTMPEGIFSKADFAMFSIVGYGTGTALDKVQPLPRIQTKTSLMMMMGRMEMPGMGGMGRPPREE